VRLDRLFNTVGFQLSALYAAVFGLSVLVLIAIVYLITSSALHRQFDLRIEAEAATMAGLIKGLDDASIAQVAQEREAAGKPRHFIYLITRDGKRVGGSMAASQPLASGWKDLDLDLSGAGEPQHYRVFALSLEGGMKLSTARDTSSIRDAERAILYSAGWALGATILLGLAGGLFVSSRFLRRVDSMTSAAQAIIDGNLHSRLPVQNTTDDLNILAHTINRMLDRISELMESVRQVSNDIAHDLRTPLSHLRHRLEVARALYGHPEELRAAIGKAIEETDVILSTFSALLRIAQIEAGTRRAAFAELDLSALVTEVADAFAPSIQDEGKFIETNIDPKISMVGDRELLTQMLANVLENAIRHTSYGTRIRVGASAQGMDIKLSVSDNGPGVPAEALGRLFDRFYRPEKSRTTPGSGLGLSLVKAIASLHGARVTLSDNRPGLCVHVLFPGQLKRTET
jgi:signal transduction histidine kinase